MGLTLRGVLPNNDAFVNRGIKMIMGMEEIDYAWFLITPVLRLLCDSSRGKSVVGVLSATTLQLTGLVNSGNTNFLTANASGSITYRTDVLTTTTTINAATGGTYSNGIITLQGTGTLSNITGFQTAN